MLHDIAIIGAGPAGLTASIYLKRTGFDPLLFERNKVGGVLLNANLVENYPGFPGGIRGEALVQLFKKQLALTGIGVRKAEVKKVFKEEFFRLDTSEGELLSRSVIVATGTMPKKIKIDGQNQFIEKKVFYEIRDIPSIKREEKFIIIGGGDAAFDYALNLSREECAVDIIFRSQEPKSLSLLVDRVKKNPKIHIFPNTSPTLLEEEDDYLIIKCNSDGDEISLISDYLLIACGRVANLKVLPDRLSKDLKVKENGETEIDGLFLIGDVRRGCKRQVGIAVGDGLLAAMAVTAFLKGGNAQ